MKYSSPQKTAFRLSLGLSIAATLFLQAGPCAGLQAVADPPKQETPTASKSDDDSSVNIDHFMRIRVDADGDPVAMETSVTRYVGTNSDGQRITVDLIGVVHVGESTYYEQLNKLFEKYDALLYELVAPEGTVIPKGGRGEGTGANPIAMLQMGMKSVLGLEFQLEHIDYTAKNFVHADMSPEEFSDSMKKNDESFLKMALKAIGQGIAQQSSSKSSMTEADLLMAMFSGNRERDMRRMMASQMQDMESGMVIFQGKDGSTIINHRNVKAFEVMQAQIDAGKTHIGVFYGAGHLPDMEKLLIKDHSMKRGGQFWMEAWNLR
jgi:hypothetical protein